MYTITRTKTIKQTLLLRKKLESVITKHVIPRPVIVVPRSPSYGVYISQLIRFARVCSNVDDFNNRNLFLTA